MTSPDRPSPPVRSLPMRLAYLSFRQSARLVPFLPRTSSRIYLARITLGLLRFVLLFPTYSHILVFVSSRALRSLPALCLRQYLAQAGSILTFCSWPAPVSSKIALASPHTAWAQPSLERPATNVFSIVWTRSNSAGWRCIPQSQIFGWALRYHPHETWIHRSNATVPTDFLCLLSNHPMCAVPHTIAKVISQMQNPSREIPQTLVIYPVQDRASPAIENSSLLSVTTTNDKSKGLRTGRSPASSTQECSSYDSTIHEAAYCKRMRTTVVPIISHLRKEKRAISWPTQETCLSYETHIAETDRLSEPCRG